MRLLLDVLKNLLGIFDNEENPRADMYLPFWLLIFGLMALLVEL